MEGMEDEGSVVKNGRCRKSSRGIMMMIFVGEKWNELVRDYGKSSRETKGGAGEFCNLSEPNEQKTRNAKTQSRWKSHLRDSL